MLIPTLAVMAILFAWTQLVRFDREAGSFDAVLAEVAERPNLTVVTQDGRGSILRMPVYWHFGAYAQARRGRRVQIRGIRSQRGSLGRALAVW